MEEVARHKQGISYLLLRDVFVKKRKPVCYMCVRAVCLWFHNAANFKDPHRVRNFLSEVKSER